ncbi:MAG TPA: peptidoglycan recognition family protein [Acidobacteriota bacterium]|nr:peptidoglycan recognition family protein [Acidobacteriota bacterium]
MVTRRGQAESNDTLGLRLTRREAVKAAASALLVSSLFGMPADSHANSLRISNQWSPLNAKRPRRPHTRHIILHTTEGEETGSLRKLVRYGEAHYFVGLSGAVVRIIDRTKIAKHAGRSMWEGRTNIDNHSLGVEVCGHHNRDITEAQYTALRELLRQLKSLYGITDDHILTHSMVAYGRPNRFHNTNHRGRKRCGMIFSRPDVRVRLGLEAQPVRDPDVEAGRLRVGDQELFAYLFTKTPTPTLVAAATGTTTAAPILEAPPEAQVISSRQTAWQIARERYNHPSTVYVFPDGRRLGGNQIPNWSAIPSGTRVLIDEMEDTQPFEGFLEIGKDGDTVEALAGLAATSSTTIFFFPDGLIRTGADLKKGRAYQKLLNNPPKGTRLLVGYVYGGGVQTRRPPSSIAGIKWNYPSTYYRYPDGRMVSGDYIDPISIPAGTLVFYQQ